MAAVALCTCGWFSRRPQELLAWYSALLHLVEAHWDEETPGNLVDVTRPHDA